jgi:hypothetical protein
MAAVAPSAPAALAVSQPPVLPAPRPELPSSAPLLPPQSPLLEVLTPPPLA